MTLRCVGRLSEVSYGPVKLVLMCVSFQCSRNPIGAVFLSLFLGGVRTRVIIKYLSASLCRLDR